MKHVLIITEDIIKIQTLSGILGRLFRFFYVGWLKNRLKLAVAILKPFFKLTIVASDAFKLGGDSVFYYGDKLAQLDYAANRNLHLKVTERLLQGMPTNLFKSRLAIYLTYEYFVYAQLYQDVLTQTKPDFIVTLSSSYHEQTARFLGKTRGVKTIRCHFLTFVWLNHWLKKFFLKRQYSKKIRQFLSQSRVTPPPLKKLRFSTLLSLDYYRHLKTLAPLYRALDKKNRHPWLVDDTARLEPILKNFKLASANHFFLASFLPKGFKPPKTSLPKRLKTVTGLSDFLYNLGLAAASPMIDLGQTLSRFYLAAAENLFVSVRPKALVVVSDVRFCELALASAARSTRTRSLLASPNTLLALDQINAYDTAETVTVVGQFIKRQLVNLGLPPKRIKVVGDPRTENYSQSVSRLDAKKVFKTLGLDHDQKIALLISFNPSHMIPKPEKEAFFKLASSAVAQVKNMTLVIKPHPSEKRYRVLEELKQWRITNAVVSDTVISINPFKKNYGFFLPIIKDGGAIEVHQMSQLKKWLSILLDKHQSQTKKQLQKAKRISADYIKPVAGRSAADQILKLLKL